MRDQTGSSPQTPESGFKSMLAPIPFDWLVAPTRFIVAWIFFSAAWRRTVLAPGKLMLDNPGWVGAKINHFLPQALGIQWMLEWMLHHPDFLAFFLVVFTIIEALVGMGVAFGLLTRISAIGVVILSFSMLLGAGWLGPTCLDEWQIGVWGIGAGLVITFTGGGDYSLDRLVAKKFPGWTRGWAALFTSGEMMGLKQGIKLAAVCTVAATFIMLWTNQAFHGGVWGKLHNDSKKPHITVSQLSFEGSKVNMKLYRDKGPDTYGAFVTEMRFLNAQGETVARLYGKEIAKAVKGHIVNEFPNKAKPGPDGLIAPLGSRADFSFDVGQDLSTATSIVLRDVSGAKWKGEVGK